MRRPLRTIALSIAAAIMCGCIVETLAVPVQEPLVQVHGILNAGLTRQQILVERMLSREQSLNPEGGTSPISGALVTVTSSTGRVYTGSPVYLDSLPVNEFGAKEPIANSLVYEFTTNPTGQSRLVPGATYTLRVQTPEGEVVTGTTKMPVFTSAALSPSRTFNRDRDTLNLSWASPVGAAAFWVRIDGIGTAFEQFLTDTHVRLSGNLKSLEFDEDRNEVFVPGFVTIITVSAMDQNVYDYFRTGNDPFTGSGRINRLVGGVGLFGSTTNVFQQRADVIADTRNPIIEGRWNLITGGAVASRGFTLRLYVDTHLDTGGDVTPILGTVASADGSSRVTVRGTLEGTNVMLQYFRGPVPDETLIGTVDGDVLRMNYERDGLAAVFIRQR